MRAASSTETSTRSTGPLPFSTSMHSITSSALPTARSERRIHGRDDRFGLHAGRVADRHERFGQAARIRGGLHERAAAGLHVEHERVDAFGDLLAHDRRADERDALDGAGHVAQRVQLLVGRRDLRGLADHRAADASERRLHLLERQVDAKAGDRLELVERAAGMARARGPDIIGTGTPHAAASGARMSDVLSPTPPVLCLSTLTPGTSDRSTRMPECTMASVSDAVSSAVIPRRTIAISSADA